jgi:hypothetical protein
MQSKIAKALKKIKSNQILLLNCYTGVCAGVAITAAGYQWHKKNLNTACNIYSSSTLLYFALQGLLIRGKSKPLQYGYAISMVALSLLPEDFVAAKFVLGMPMYTLTQDNDVSLCILQSSICPTLFKCPA